MVTQSPELKLSNGQRIPMVGLGTPTREEAQGGLPVDQVIEQALRQGYRLIDTAYVNENEQEVGEGLKRAFDQNIVRREEVFVVSKLWNTFHRAEKVEQGVRESLKALKLEQLDLYLMHWPISMVPDQGLWPKEGGRVKLDKEADFVQTWKAMEKLVEMKLVKSIGLSNVNKDQLQRIVKEGKIRPAVIQNEVHPYCRDQELLDYCQKEDIVVMAYSPFGHSDRQRSDLLKNDTIQEISEKERLTPAQVVLLWNLTENRVVIPRAANQQQIKEDFEFLTKMHKLPKEEAKKIDQLSRGKQVRTADPQQIFNVKIF